MNQNPLYPIFLKLSQLNVLIVGAGKVGFEKLTFMLKSSPDARITVVAPQVSEGVQELLRQFPHVQLIRRPYLSDDLRNRQLVIAATNDRPLNERIRADARARALLINVADTPELCDFYLGAIVTRGDLKVAISTNGKSPTFARRFRQLLEAVLPGETAPLLLNLRAIREQLQGDFSQKVKTLNQLTAGLLAARQGQRTG